MHARLLNGANGRWAASPAARRACRTFKHSPLRAAAVPAAAFMSSTAGLEQLGILPPELLRMQGEARAGALTCPSSWGPEHLGAWVLVRPPHHVVKRLHIDRSRTNARAPEATPAPASACRKSVVRHHHTATAATSRPRPPAMPTPPPAAWAAPPPCSSRHLGSWRSSAGGRPLHGRRPGGRAGWVGAGTPERKGHCTAVRGQRCRCSKGQQRDGNTCAGGGVGEPQKGYHGRAFHRGP